MSEASIGHLKILMDNLTVAMVKLQQDTQVEPVQLELVVEDAVFDALYAMSSMRNVKTTNDAVTGRPPNLVFFRIYTDNDNDDAVPVIIKRRACGFKVGGY